MRNKSINAGLARRAPGCRSVCQGVTIVELMVVLSILAVLLTVGIPSYTNLLHKNRISETSGLLHVSLNLARGEAIKQRRQVQVCPTADGGSCRNDGVWSEGWLVFADADGDNAPDDGEVVRFVNTLGDGVEIQVSAAIDDFLRFQPTGMVIGDGGFAGQFRICHAASGVHSNVLAVTPAGQVRLSQESAAECGAAL